MPLPLNEVFSVSSPSGQLEALKAPCPSCMSGMDKPHDRHSIFKGKGWRVGVNIRLGSF